MSESRSIRERHEPDSSPIRTSPVQSPPRPLKPVVVFANADDARQVILTGDFTDWSLHEVPMTRGSDGKWRATLHLSPGEYRYRLLVDGEWRNPENPSKRVPNPFGTEDFILVVS